MGTFFGSWEKYFESKLEKQETKDHSVTETSWVRVEGKMGVTALDFVKTHFIRFMT